MSTIYLVKADEGEYDDYRHWVVKAFSTKELADMHVVYLNHRMTTHNLYAKKLREFSEKWEEGNKCLPNEYTADWANRRDGARKEYLTTTSPLLDTKMVEELIDNWHSSDKEEHYSVEEIELD